MKAAALAFDWANIGPFLAIAIVVFAFLFPLWLTYFILKCAIRNGIKESGLVEALARSVVMRRLDGEPAKLPEMKAD